MRCNTTVRIPNVAENAPYALAVVYARARLSAFIARDRPPRISRVLDTVLIPSDSSEKKSLSLKLEEETLTDCFFPCSDIFFPFCRLEPGEAYIFI